MQPAVSVIVPMYKTEKTVARCLDSILAQTLKEIEVVVVDDGSPDGGYKVVEKYVQKDSRVRLFRTENAGLGAARNYGIRQARGTYVGFVDSDDYIAPEMYEEMHKAVVETGARLCVCQEKNVYFNEDGDVQELGGTEYPGQGVLLLHRQQVLDWYLNSVYLALNSACFKLVDKTVFTKDGVWFPEQYRYAEDLVASAGMYSVVEKVAVVCKSFYYYVHEYGSITYNYSVQKAYDVLKDYEEACDYISQTSYAGTLSNFALSMQFSSLKQIYWSRENKNGEQAKKLKSLWKQRKREGNWKPKLKGLPVPMEHKIKIWVSYLGITRFACFAISRLRWIPFFKYMT